MYFAIFKSIFRNFLIIFEGVTKSGLKRDYVNIEYSKQALRAACSVGANYIEANEPLGKKDFLFRIKICRKEIKEFIYWLSLIKEANADLIVDECEKLFTEATELKKIFSSIIERCQLTSN